MDIEKEMEMVTSIDDTLSYELNEILFKMWQYPSKEYVIVYHPENISLFKVNTFNNLLQLLHIPTIENKEGYIDPVIVFSCMGSYMGTITYDRKYPSELKPHDSLIFDKIKINKYQDWYIKNKTVNIKLKSLNNISFAGSSNFQIPYFQDLSVKRHPQLRRILKEYFLLIDQKFDEKLLFERLSSLGIQDINYQYWDYDELFLNNSSWYNGTYFETVPSELKNIIIKIIDNQKYFNYEDIHKKTEPIVKTIENILDIISETDNASMIDIYEKASERGYLDDFFNSIKSNPDTQGNIYKYITSTVGINNIKDIVNDKMNKK